MRVVARPVALGILIAAPLLSSCGGVTIKPEPILPKPLIIPMDTDVGLIIPAESSHYVEKETRFGVDWKVELGPGETRLMHDVFKDLFHHVEELKDLDAAREAKDLKAVFEPRIEQYSFVTAHETGGRYYAVTIRYRINLYTPQAEKVDSFTLTGYGNALAKGMSGGTPLEQATVAAMRDAAAKFLVQFPEQPAGQQLARNEALALEKATTADASQIEAVPIEEPSDDLVAVPAQSAAPATGPSNESAAPSPKADTAQTTTPKTQ